MDVPPLVELLAVQPVRAYDKTSLDQFVIAAEHERERLQAALDRAVQRRAIAEQGIADGAQMKTRLSEMIEETQRLVIRLKRENERAVAAILAAAEAEADALVARRRAEISLFAPIARGAEHTSSADPVEVDLTVLPAG